jgi:hypothetical protein
MATRQFATKCDMFLFEATFRAPKVRVVSVVSVRASSELLAFSARAPLPRFRASVREGRCKCRAAHALTRIEVASALLQTHQAAQALPARQQAHARAARARCDSAAAPVPLSGVGSAATQQRRKHTQPWPRQTWRASPATLP